MGDGGGRARAAAGRGEGECPGRGGGASQQAGGVGQSGVRRDGVEEGGRLIIVPTRRQSRRLDAMGMARAGRGHMRKQCEIVPRFTRCGQWRGRGEERACDEGLGH